MSEEQRSFKSTNYYRHHIREYNDHKMMGRLNHGRVYYIAMQVLLDRDYDCYQDEYLKMCRKHRYE